MLVQCDNMINSLSRNITINTEVAYSLKQNFKLRFLETNLGESLPK